eukprot:Gb_36543 [translate_table: standard]
MGSLFGGRSVNGEGALGEAIGILEQKGLHFLAFKFLVGEESLKERSRSIIMHKPWSVRRFNDWLDGGAVLGLCCVGAALEFIGAFLSLATLGKNAFIPFWHFPLLLYSWTTFSSPVLIYLGSRNLPSSLPLLPMAPISFPSSRGCLHRPARSSCDPRCLLPHLPLACSTPNTPWCLPCGPSWSPELPPSPATNTTP